MTTVLCILSEVASQWTIFINNLCGKPVTTDTKRDCHAGSGLLDRTNPKKKKQWTYTYCYENHIFNILFYTWYLICTKPYTSYTCFESIMEVGAMFRFCTHRLCVCIQTRHVGRSFYRHICSKTYEKVSSFIFPRLIVVRVI